mmetsp:Transcript_35764/g.89205  ORF Transcript_35764/g.89205 Transcript_35764/m.89205 type:complete len:206 (-) Transcript_35764:2957-3574(-)
MCSHASCSPTQTGGAAMRARGGHTLLTRTRVRSHRGEAVRSGRARAPAGGRRPDGRRPTPGRTRATRRGSRAAPRALAPRALAPGGAMGPRARGRARRRRMRPTRAGLPRVAVCASRWSSAGLRSSRPRWPTCVPGCQAGAAPARKARHPATRSAASACASAGGDTHPPAAGTGPEWRARQCRARIARRRRRARCPRPPPAAQRG